MTELDPIDVPRPSPRDLTIHVLLFLACCVTTWWAGELNSGAFTEDVYYLDPKTHAWIWGELSGGVPHAGLYFSGTLMGILLCHEAGHYVFGRRHGVPVSL